MLKLVVVSCLLVSALGALERYPAEDKPACFADQEGCYLSDLDAVLPYDQNVYPHVGTRCDRYYCQSSDNTTVVATCGVLAIRPGCTKADGDLTKTYPACCDYEQC